MIRLCYQALFCSSGMNSILFLILEISWTLPGLQNRLMEVKSKRCLQHRWLMRSCQEVSTQKQELLLKRVAKHSRVTHDGWLRPKLILKCKFNRKTSVIQKFMNQSETWFASWNICDRWIFFMHFLKTSRFSLKPLYTRDIIILGFPFYVMWELFLKFVSKMGLEPPPPLPLPHLLPSPDNLAGLNF